MQSASLDPSETGCEVLGAVALEHKDVNEDEVISLESIFSHVVVFNAALASYLITDAVGEVGSRSPSHTSGTWCWTASMPRA